MKIVIIDHQDSFTYNIVELIRQAVDLEPDIIPADAINLDDLSKYDKIILSPGPGLPRDFVNIKHILDRYKTSKSILGICLGHQAIAQYFGSKLENLSFVIHGQPKQIEVVNQNKLFYKIPLVFTVGLYHSWVVSKVDLAQDLQIDAFSTDGMIMALSHKQYNIYGVQFHPESYITEYGRQLIKNFVYA